jgi:methionyl-tRNA synthetase
MSELSFGNFVNRALQFVSKNYDRIIPDGGDTDGPLSPNDQLDADFVSDINSLLQQYIAAMEAVKLRLGLHLVMQISSRGNLYLQASGLNTALKQSDPTRCAQVVTRAINLIYLLSVLVEPFMPATSAAILAQLNAPSRSVPTEFSIDILPGHHIGTPAHLFKPIDEKMAEVWRAKFAGSQKQPAVQAGSVSADATHVAPGQAQATAVSKRKAAAAAKKAAAEAVASAGEGPKSPEVLELEAKIAAQGDKVRTLKSQPKGPEVDEQITKEVEELKKLKAELVNELKKQKQ